MSGDGVRLVVGVEVHVQLATRTKAFCPCPVEFGAPPNTLCCPVCMGHPGALPVLNAGAVEQAFRAGRALGCTLLPRGRTRWDRKNYFYPDLPRGYQITQYDFPLCEHGTLELPDGAQVRIRRAHLEEDTGKSSHARDGATILDFNRCGAPLLEIVSEPDLSTPEGVEAYLRLLQQRVRECGAAEARMERGQMRCEPNVSVVRADGWSSPISELKNLNSFVAARAAVAFERDRLAAGDVWFPPGTAPSRATFGWDDARGVTVLQRTKETAADYRYFPEPDLPELSAEDLASVLEGSRRVLDVPGGLLDGDPMTLRERLVADGEEPASAERMVDSLRSMSPAALRALARIRGLVRSPPDPAAVPGAFPLIARWFLGPVAARLRDDADWDRMGERGLELESAAALQIRGAYPAQVLKEHLLGGGWLEAGGDPRAFLEAKGLREGGAADGAGLRAVCEEVLAASPDIVAKIRGGRPQAKSALFGQIMKKTRGTADPAAVHALLDELLGGPHASS